MTGVGSQRLHEVRRFVIATLAVVVTVTPIYFIAIGGLMTNVEIHRQPPYIIPPAPTLASYLEAWEDVSHSLLNSLITGIGVAVLTLAASAPASFALAKLRLKVERPTMFLMTFALILPATALAIPLFLIFHSIGLVNSRFGVILAVCVLTMPFATVILTAYMRSIPATLIEAARLDGASLLRVFWHIILPMSRSTLATAGVLVFLLGWGDFIFSVSFLHDRPLQPASVALFRFVGQYGTQWNLLMAGSMLYALPPIIAVIIGGKALVSGLTAGAIKE